MKQLLIIPISCLLLFLVLGGCTSAERVTDNRRQDFTADWTFHLGDDSAASRPDYDDTHGGSSIFHMTGLSRESSVRIILPEQEEGHYPVVSVGIAKRLLLTKRMKASACILILTVYI